jgi:two-component sensor histidine kinase
MFWEAVFPLLSLFPAHRSESTAVPVLKFNFRDGSLIEEVRGLKARGYATSPAPDRFGNSASALFFHGTAGSYLNLGSDRLLKPDSGSISVWFKIQNEMLNGRGIGINPIITTHSHGGDDHNEAYTVGYDFNTHQLNANTSFSKEQQVTVYSASGISLRDWHHVVVTYDDRFLCMYIDGVLEIKVFKNFRSRFLSGDSVIVANRTGPKNSRYFNGCIDDIYFFDRVLTPAEVTDLYKAPNPNKSAVLIKWSAVALAGMALLLAILYLIRLRIRYAVRDEKMRNELQNRLITQEMQVLKAQMDPHFIFNALNTLQQFIISRENDKARVYLAKFSKLIRKLLEHDTSDSIALSEEMEIIKHYLEIESLRFNNVFEYTISVESPLQSEQVKIPHFIVQPFVENAIWHGLLPKEGAKSLAIKFSSSEAGRLTCTVEDNGIGIEASRRKPVKGRRSLAIGFVRQRLDVMGKIQRKHYDVHITERRKADNTVEGTIVKITMPLTAI